MTIDWQIVLADFKDLGNLDEALRVTLRMVVAMVLGGAIGLERELKHKPAGLRTHMIVSLGSALFVITSEQSGMSPGDISRVVQGVVTGIGFLGAGAIVKLSDASQIKGLTTAASIWLTTAIGVAVGFGEVSTAILATLLALVVLTVLARVEEMTEATRDEHL